MGCDSAKIKSLTQLLRMDLAIPSYQRPYKWSKRNVTDLLDDIDHAVERSGTAQSTFRYRIGTVILHRNVRRGTYDVVDGQQRIITLLLIRRCFAQDRRFIPMKLDNRETQAHLAANYATISEWARLKPGGGAAVLQAFSHTLEAVVITVEDVSEAFQLFDSQNSRGRELDPHDLLKAYHLREMRGTAEMRQAVTTWEAVDPTRIKELFGQYLFPILKWSDRDRSIPFTAQEIQAFKGIPDSSAYTYALRARKSMPCFQITDPFIAGGAFFTMVDHYLALLDELRDGLRQFDRLHAILEDRSMAKSVGFRYARTLFECALLSYYDRFCILDERAVKKLFTWAFMLRVDMESLGFDSVNRYALGQDGYTNSLPMFYLIRRARLHTDISNLEISVDRTPNEAGSPKWNDLYQVLKELNGR